MSMGINQHITEYLKRTSMTGQIQ